MKAKKYSLILLIVFVVGVIWDWSNKKSMFGYIITVLFLLAAILNLIAYKKNLAR